MRPKSPKSLELYGIMIKRGYPAEFCDQITKNLNTDLDSRTDDRLFVPLQKAAA